MPNVRSDFTLMLTYRLPQTKKKKIDIPFNIQKLKVLKKPDQNK